MPQPRLRVLRRTLDSTTCATTHLLTTVLPRLDDEFSLEATLDRLRRAPRNMGRRAGDRVAPSRRRRNRVSEKKVFCYALPPDYDSQDERSRDGGESDSECEYECDSEDEQRVVVSRVPSGKKLPPNGSSQSSTASSSSTTPTSPKREGGEKRPDVAIDSIRTNKHEHEDIVVNASIRSPSPRPSKSEPYRVSMASPSPMTSASQNEKGQVDIVLNAKNSLRSSKHEDIVLNSSFRSPSPKPRASSSTASANQREQKDSRSSKHGDIVVGAFFRSPGSKPRPSSSTASAYQREQKDVDIILNAKNSLRSSKHQDIVVTAPIRSPSPERNESRKHRDIVLNKRPEADATKHRDIVLNLKDEPSRSDIYVPPQPQTPDSAAPKEIVLASPLIPNGNAGRPTTPKRTVSSKVRRYLEALPSTSPMVQNMLVETTTTKSPRRSFARRMPPSPRRASGNEDTGTPLKRTVTPFPSDKSTEVSDETTTTADAEQEEANKEKEEAKKPLRRTVTPFPGNGECDEKKEIVDGKAVDEKRHLRRTVTPFPKYKSTDDLKKIPPAENAKKPLQRTVTPFPVHPSNAKIEERDTKKKTIERTVTPFPVYKSNASEAPAMPKDVAPSMPPSMPDDSQVAKKSLRRTVTPFPVRTQAATSTNDDDGASIDSDDDEQEEAPTLERVSGLTARPRMLGEGSNHSTCEEPKSPIKRTVAPFPSFPEPQANDDDDDDDGESWRGDSESEEERPVVDSEEPAEDKNEDENSHDNDDDSSSSEESIRESLVPQRKSWNDSRSNNIIRTDHIDDIADKEHAGDGESTDCISIASLPQIKQGTATTNDNDLEASMDSMAFVGKKVSFSEDVQVLECSIRGHDTLRGMFYDDEEIATFRYEAFLAEAGLDAADFDDDGDENANELRGPLEDEEDVGAGESVIEITVDEDDDDSSSAIEMTIEDDDDGIAAAMYGSFSASSSGEEATEKNELTNIDGALTKPSESDTFNCRDKEVLCSDTKGCERGAAVHFDDEHEVYEISKHSRTILDHLFYEEDEIAEFRYEAYCEQAGLDPSDNDAESQVESTSNLDEDGIHLEGQSSVCVSAQ